MFVTQIYLSSSIAKTISAAKNFRLAFGSVICLVAAIVLMIWGMYRLWKNKVLSSLDFMAIPGKPGCFEDVSIDYETPMKYLREHGYEGYINSEYEGQRDQQDRGIEFLPNEAEQVRRHHEMLRRLSP